MQHSVCQPPKNLSAYLFPGYIGQSFEDLYRRWLITGYTESPSDEAWVGYGSETDLGNL